MGSRQRWFPRLQALQENVVTLNGRGGLHSGRRSITGGLRPSHLTIQLTPLISHNVSHTRSSHATHLTPLISHHSPLTTHLSPLLSHYSSRPFISHYSFDTAHLTLRISHHSSHTKRLTPLIPHHSSQTTHLTSFISHRTYLTARLIRLKDTKLHMVGYPVLFKLTDFFILNAFLLTYHIQIAGPR